MKVSEVGFIYSDHYGRDNISRELVIRRISSANDTIVAKYYINREHISGSEFHWICSNGVIIVTNAEKCGGKMVCTKLIARPAQLTRYREMGLVNELDETTRTKRNWMIPQWLIAKAFVNQKVGLNNR